MIKEFVLIALVQVPTYVPDEPSTYELRPVEYHSTMQECKVSLKTKVPNNKTPSYQCLRRDFN
jgi:hypothetical protein